MHSSVCVTAGPTVDPQEHNYGSDSDDMETGDEYPGHSFLDAAEHTASTNTPCDRILTENLDEKGVFHDAALFVSRLNSNPKMTLSAVNDIVNSCTEMLAPSVLAVKEDIHSIMHQHDILLEKAESLLKVLDVIENPFVGIDTAWKQNKYLERNGYYIEPQSFLTDSYVAPVAGKLSE